MTDPVVDEPRRPGSGKLLAALVALGVLVVGGFFAVRAIDDGAADAGPIKVSDADDLDAYDHEFVIPLGTAARIANGELVDIVPRELVVKVGESIRIINDDVTGATVGVFYVGAGETLTQQFDSEGVLEGICDVHPSGSFTLRVEKA